MKRGALVSEGGLVQRGIVCPVYTPVCSSCMLKIVLNRQDIFLLGT
jgi:hypothetical protein